MINETASISNECTNSFFWVYRVRLLTRYLFIQYIQCICMKYIQCIVQIHLYNIYKNTQQ